MKNNFEKRTLTMTTSPLFFLKGIEYLRTQFAQLKCQKFSFNNIISSLSFQYPLFPREFRMHFTDC